MRLVYVENGRRQCGRCHRAMNWNCGIVGSTEHPIGCLFCASLKIQARWEWVLGWMQAAEAAVRPHDAPPF